jgi:sodium-dependent dicarboxylate transporter 2/3/5
MRKIIGAVLSAAASAAVLFLLKPAGLDPAGHKALAVIVLAVGFWATDVLASGITAVGALGLLLAFRIPPATALAGFSSSAFWILISVLFFGRAMEKTGLARRISYRILLIFKPTYNGIIFAFLVIGVILAFGIPSMTVRTAIMIPIAWAIVQALELPLPGRGSALIILSTFQMAVLPGCAILTGALWGPYLTGLYNSLKLPITWLGYAKVMAVPTIILCVLVLLANRLALAPKAGAPTTREIVREQYRKLGAMTSAEKLTALVIGLSVVAWITQPLHKVPAEAIGMMALTLLFAAKVLVPAEIGTGISWNLALFVGGVLSLSAVITAFKISAWLGNFIIPAIQPFAGNPWLLLTAIAALVVVMRFIDPVGFITIGIFFLTLHDFIAARGMDPLVLVGAIYLPLHIFWFPYQNIWTVITEGVTGKKAYTDGDRFKSSFLYLGAALIALWASIFYWKLIGAM